MRRLGVLGLDRLDFFAALERENPNVVACVGVGRVQPKLVKLVGRGAFRVEPHIAALGLAKLGAVGLLNQRRGEREGLAAAHAANQLGSGGDVAPLVASAHLQADSVVLPQVVKVVALNELVAELREADARFLAAFHRILGQHVVDRDVLAHVANELEEAHFFEPIVVVHDAGSVRTAKVQELFELVPLARKVVLQRVHIEQLALGRLERRIAHHAGSAPNQRIGLVARPLKMHEHHDLHQVAYPKRVGRGVKSNVGLLGARVQKVLGTRHAVVQHAPPAEFVNKRSHATKLGRRRGRATFGL